MIRRFTDLQEGKRRLVECLLEQIIISNNNEVASFFAENCVLRELNPSEILINQEDNDSDVHFIIAGSFSVVINGREVAVRVSKQHVGEMALIDPSAKRSAAVVAKEVSVVATITEAQFTKIANEHPLVWRRIAVELSHRLRERSKYIKYPNGKPLVFIGSSSENLNVAKIIREELHGDSQEVNIWSEDGIFELSKSSLDSLISAARYYDFAIMIFDENDIIESRENMQFAPRDNVIFELGLFMGSLGAERSFILRSNSADLKIPSDLLGITTIMYEKSDLEKSIAPIVAQVSSAIAKLGPK